MVRHIDQTRAMRYPSNVMWWTRYRKFRHKFLIAVFGSTNTVLLAMILQRTGMIPGMIGTAEKLVFLFLGVFFGMSLVLYVVEEIASNVMGKGHLCVNCGRQVPMGTFSVRTRCPYCKEPL